MTNHRSKELAFPKPLLFMDVSLVSGDRFWNDLIYLYEVKCLYAVYPLCYMFVLVVLILGVQLLGLELGESTPLPP